MNFNWPDYENRDLFGYYIAPRSSPQGKQIPNKETVEDKPFFASNIEHYPHLPQPNGLSWVPKYLTYADLSEAVDKGFDPIQLRPANQCWSQLKSQGQTLFDWPTYTQSQVQLGANNEKQENWRLPNGENMGPAVAYKNSTTWPNLANQQFAGAAVAPQQRAPYGYGTDMHY
ncbi:uncharacterized protein LOC121405494 [Drosophila obscura]|uniref:uncharacterized protein LOC121405494 n=1 Tax=Drosophila obscura TaxID=7282 RepID=UPI001BB18D09|nr:uncharacterized protein LOC121405494 [Drosophila obscura]